MSKYAIMAVLLTASLATACATPTAYQPADDDAYGYADQPLEEQRYRVRFAGNRWTPREKVEDYLLYRAAQITVRSGHDYFVIEERDTDRLTRYFAAGPIGVYNYQDRGWFSPFDGTITRFLADPVDYYTAIATISVHSGAKPAGGESAFAAREVIERLKPQIVLPQEKS